MTAYCEVCESIAHATSSVRSADATVSCRSSANGTSKLRAGYYAHGTSTANATSKADGEDFALLRSSARATSRTVNTIRSGEKRRSSANARSRLVAGTTQDCRSSASSSSRVYGEAADGRLISRAHATSAVVTSRLITTSVRSSANARSAVKPGYFVFSTSYANASSRAYVRRAVKEDLWSSAHATSAVYLSTSIDSCGDNLYSSALATSHVVTRLNVATTLVSSHAGAFSRTIFRDPTRSAWVMNTETTAMSGYENYDFNSIVSWRGKEYAVGVDGIYELSGDDDDGVKINAKIKTGYSDFGTPNTKRLDGIYFGYKSTGTLSTCTEVYESGHPPATYQLEPREADSMRNSRVVPGKGLWGRYWRLTTYNVEGAYFEIHDCSVDVAASTRRV